MAKSISATDQAYQYIKELAAEEGFTQTEVVNMLVAAHKKTSSPATRRGEAEQVIDPAKLSTVEVDEGMGYERKPDEVTARDGLAALYALSRGNNNNLGIDRS